MNNNWNRFLNEGEEQDRPVIDLNEPIEGGFCKWNPQINKFAQESPENFANLLIFVYASIQMAWPNLVPIFPYLMDWVEKNDGLFNPELKYTDQETGKIRHYTNKPGEPNLIDQAIYGQTSHIDNAWKNRDKIYSTFKPLLDKFNNAGENSIARESAVMEIFVQFLYLPGLKLPKAGFATQLAIGRLGCIDSINIQLYQHLDPERKIISVKRATGKAKGFKFPTPTPRAEAPDDPFKSFSVGKDKVIQYAEKYVEFLKVIGASVSQKNLGTSEALWNGWTAIVAQKIQSSPGEEFDIILPGGKVHPSKGYKGLRKDADPFKKFLAKYHKQISPEDVARQHLFWTMYERKYIESVHNLILNG
jgi:hypothetical protein